tara:strand:- start:4023 stop:4640 length:618 start_codon:yes stop_codon:yes gene_type:complete
MSVSSLTKFTVPIDGDQSAASQGLLMPKLKYRFRASFENFGVSTPRTEMTKQIMNITRPAVTFDENMIDIYNSKVYLVGKHTWDPITVNLRDDVNGAISRLCGEQIQKQFDFMEQSSAASGIDYKFITRFEILDGGNGANTPNVLETWELYGCFVQNINYNELDYATQDPANITMSIRFDNAVQTPLGDGIGASVDRTLGQVITG